MTPERSDDFYKRLLPIHKVCKELVSEFNDDVYDNDNNDELMIHIFNMIDDLAFELELELDL